VFAHQERLDLKRDKLLVRPGFRERVEEFMRDQWHEPVIVLCLGDTDLGFDVPGRRMDGTVKGKRLVRRFFWNVLRGIGGAGAFVFSLVNGVDPRGAAHLFNREIRVTGPANAMALDLLDKLGPVKGRWLVFSPSSIAVVDTGSTLADPAAAPAPQIAWQARKPQAPAVSFRTRTLTWPDGSSFTFPLQGRTEVRHLRKYHESPDIIHWNGDRLDET
jgi:hypothetical protein